MTHFLCRYAKTYQIIGSLELLLRSRISEALREYSGSPNHEYWLDHLPLTWKGIESVNRAKSLLASSRNPESEKLENYLPFSFWRYLLTKRNYTTLWLPTLHKAFPNIQNSLEFNTYKNLDHRMSRALKTRNSIAHYNEKRFSLLSEDEENILTLIRYLN